MTLHFALQDTPRQPLFAVDSNYIPSGRSTKKNMDFFSSNFAFRPDPLRAMHGFLTATEPLLPLPAPVESDMYTPSVIASWYNGL